MSPRHPSRGAQPFLAVPGGSQFEFPAMRTALCGSTALFPGLGLPQMRMLHGTLNAIGFGLCGVLAWRRMGRAE